MTPEQIQPASLDLRLGRVAYRVRASFLPGAGRFAVSDRLQGTLALHEIDITNGGAVLETGCVYIVPLLEELALDDDIAAAANPKSSTGRLDVFTRVIADGAREFDQIEHRLSTGRCLPRSARAPFPYPGAHRHPAVADPVPPRRA